MTLNRLESLRKNIAVILAESGLTQSELAERLGVGKQLISRYLRGVTIPGTDNLIKIADALGVPPFILLMTPQERALWNTFKSMAQSSIFPNLTESQKTELFTESVKKKKK